MVALSTLNMHPLFGLEKIYKAYRKCRRRKRKTINALIFEQNLEENLLTLRDELQAGTYRPSPPMAFLVEKPKLREIFAADFRDRIVHHLLVGHLEPLWEQRFIHDSYACRKKRGTHKGVERVQSFMRKATSNNTRQAWYLQLDIRGFFMSIDRNILYKRIIAKESDSVVRWLLSVIIYKEPTTKCRFRDCTLADFKRLPNHKTLFKAKPDCGLPIGNLTSQFFANVYLDSLDQFVKHKLKAKFYVRYCDDFILISREPDQLRQWEHDIEEFLGSSLELKLNNLRRLQPVSNGIDFLGYIIRPNYLLVRHRVVVAFKERLNQVEQKLNSMGMKVTTEGIRVFPWPTSLLEQLRQQVNSYLGHFYKASCHNLLIQIWQRYPWLNEYFKRQGNKVVCRCPTPRYTLRYRQQKKWFSRLLPKHFLMIQIGSYWDVVLPLHYYTEPSKLFTSIVRSCRISDRALHRLLLPKLLAGKLSIAFICETGRRLSTIAERTLVCRFDGVSC